MNARAGKVLRIEKTSIHDGKGLRTVVFVKGCPLKCKWCSTPESQSMECMMDYGYDADPEDILKEIRKDEIFYFHSGGGVTISGGEVLMQSDFVRDILAGCREEGVPVTIESTLFGPYEALEKLLPYLNEVYVDFKMADDEMHKYYTGVSNRLIKDNILKLNSNYRGPIHIRIPTIPSINMTEENMSATAEFLRPLDQVVDVELLAYHRLGVDTYRKLDQEYELADIETPGSEDMLQTGRYLRNCDPGCEVLINGVKITDSEFIS